MADLMGELRGALHEPCVESWQRIIALLDECKDRDQLVQEAIPYAHGLISRWPQDVPRDIPRAWAKGFHNEGPISPELYDLVTLVDNISPVYRYGSRHNEVMTSVKPSQGGSALPLLARKFFLRFPTSREHLSWLFESEAPNLVSFSLEYRDFDASLVAKLRQATWFGEKLEHLRLVIPDDAMFALLVDIKLPGVKSVDLSDARDTFDELGIFALLEALDGASIERFDLNGHSLNNEILEVLAEHDVLKHIEDLDIRFNMRHLYRSAVDDFLESPNLQPHTKQSIQEYYDDIFE